MVSPSTFLRALAAAVGLACLVPVPGAHAAPGPAPAVDDAPLRVAISTMTPGALPATGNIRITGTVTNTTNETWTGISLYTFLGDLRPAMRNQGELERAMASPYDEYLGNRLTEVGQGVPGEVDELAPGATAAYVVTVPADALAVSEAGVYWFGVHALGASDSAPDDGLADGRARTFLPYVPRRFHDAALPAALVVPLAQPVRHEADGTLSDVEGWARALAPDGRLSLLLDFVDTGVAPVTWLVDPAVVDAIAQIAAGNPPRDLGPSPGAGAGDDPGEDDTAAPSPDEPAEPTEPTEGSTEETDAEPLPASALTAAAFLERLRTAFATAEVRTLPYGNIDVPAAVRHEPGLVEVALAQRSEVLADLGVEPSPVVASPSGYLDPASIAATDADTQVLVTDRMFGDKPPAVARVADRRLVATSYGATQGSPGPGASLTPVGIRQRLLAEAAVRVIKGERKPLSVVLPLGWDLGADPTGFFAGLDVPWLELATLDDAVGGVVATEVGADDLDYVRLQGRRELDAPTVAGVAELIGAGDVLQDVLVDNNRVGGAITEEALTGLSYFARNSQTATRYATGQSRAWVEERLGAVEITAAPGVTLSGASGTFPVTLSNTLDQSVTVGIGAESDDGIEIVAPAEIELAPQSRTTLELEARTTSNRVHNVRLQVTDPAGTTALGSEAELPIRSVQVSGVIWLIMGTGAGLLVLAIAVRLFRRIRAARGGGAVGAVGAVGGVGAVEAVEAG